MATLLARFKYSREKQRAGLKPHHSIQFSEGADTKAGTDSLASAIRLYLRFGDDSLSPTSFIQSECSDRVKPMAPAPPHMVSLWPNWKLPGNEELLQLAKVTIPYICFLHPDIVRLIVADNQLHRDTWEARLAECGVDPSLYL